MQRERAILLAAEAQPHNPPHGKGMPAQRGEAKMAAATVSHCYWLRGLPRVAPPLSNQQWVGGTARQTVLLASQWRRAGQYDGQPSRPIGGQEQGHRGPSANWRHGGNPTVISPWKWRLVLWSACKIICLPPCRGSVPSHSGLVLEVILKPTALEMNTNWM